MENNESAKIRVDVPWDQHRGDLFQNNIPNEPEEIKNFFQKAPENDMYFGLIDE